jgi:hypothetical protein
MGYVQSGWKQQALKLPSFSFVLPRNLAPIAHRILIKKFSGKMSAASALSY